MKKLTQLMAIALVIIFLIAPFITFSPDSNKDYEDVSEDYLTNILKPSSENLIPVTSNSYGNFFIFKGSLQKINKYILH